MRRIVVGLFACLIGAAPLRAEPYPDRPIAIVVPFGKATTADLIAAVVAEAVSKNIGQKVIVELKPGAGGGIAMEQVEKAAPDKPGKVRLVTSYTLKPGMAHVYHEGDLHSPRREGATRLIRIEGTNMDKVRRLAYERA